MSTSREHRLYDHGCWNRAGLERDYLNSFHDHQKTPLITHMCRLRLTSNMRWQSTVMNEDGVQKGQKEMCFDACMIRTCAPEGMAFLMERPNWSIVRVPRVNHSAKAPWRHLMKNIAFTNIILKHILTEVEEWVTIVVRLANSGANARSSRYQRSTKRSLDSFYRYCITVALHYLESR